MLLSTKRILALLNNTPRKLNFSFTPSNITKEPVNLQLFDVSNGIKTLICPFIVEKYLCTSDVKRKVTELILPTWKLIVNRNKRMMWWKCASRAFAMDTQLPRFVVDQMLLHFSDIVTHIVYNVHIKVIRRHRKYFRKSLQVPSRRFSKTNRPKCREISIPHNKRYIRLLTHMHKMQTTLPR